MSSQQAFACDAGAPFVIRVYIELVGDRPGADRPPEIYLEPDRACASLRADSVEPAPHFAGALDAQFEAIRQEAEGVRQAALVGAVPADDGRHRRQVPCSRRVPQLAERDVFERPVVFDPESFDSRHGDGLPCNCLGSAAQRARFRHAARIKGGTRVGEAPSGFGNDPVRWQADPAACRSRMAAVRFVFRRFVLVPGFRVHVSGMNASIPERPVHEAYPVNFSGIPRTGGTRNLTSRV